MKNKVDTHARPSAGDSRGDPAIAPPQRPAQAGWVDFDLAPDRRQLAAVEAAGPDDSHGHWWQVAGERFGFAPSASPTLAPGCRIDQLDRLSLDLYRLVLARQAVRCTRHSHGQAHIPFMMALRGCARIHSQEGLTTLEPGGLATFGALDDGADGSIVCDGVFEAIVLLVDRWWLEERFDDRVMYTHPVGADAPMAGLLREALRSLILVPPASPAGRVMPVVVRDTLAHALGVELSRSTNVTTYRGRMTRLLSFVGQYHVDAELTPATAAAALGCSLSLLHKTCARYRTTFNKLLMHCRLLAGARLLRNEKLSIADVAFRCGFNEHSYFSKQFKERYGMSPLAYRASATCLDGVEARPRRR